MYFYYFTIISPLRNWPSGSGEEDFLFKLSSNFNYFSIISPFGRAWPFMWTNLNPLHQEKLYAELGSNWPSDSGEVENVNTLQTDGQTDDRWQVMRKPHLSFWIRWLKKLQRKLFPVTPLWFKECRRLFFFLKENVLLFCF